MNRQNNFKSIVTVATLVVGSSLLTLTPVMAGGIQKLADFNAVNGSIPYNSLTLGTDGLFYGTTFVGGSSSLGNIFSFNPTGNVLTSLASFNGANGSYPRAGLTLGTDGLFYGTSLRDSSGSGNIFSFNPTGNVLTSLVSFNVATGNNPFTSLTLGTNGLFYGTTANGGSFGSGNIFSFNPTGNVLTSLAIFNGANGFSPDASLTLGTDGFFYGTTNTGSGNKGTIFSFKHLSKGLGRAFCYLPLGSCVVDADADYLFPYFFSSMMVLDVGMFSPSLSTFSFNLT